MKTKEQLQQRLKDVREKIRLSQEKFAEYNGILTKVNEWRGHDIEFMELKELERERNFIDRALRYLF